MRISAESDHRDAIADRARTSVNASQSIDWYAEGEERIVEAGGVQIAVRFVGRKGRRGRIAITAPPGAAFRASDRTEAVRPSDEPV